MIAFERIGNGVPVILVDGGFCDRGMGQSGHLAQTPRAALHRLHLRPPGRGESGDTPPYAVEREADDIAALLSEAGGGAFRWGMSSGAVLALEAAGRLRGIRKLAVYQAPFIVDDSRPTTENHWIRIGEEVEGTPARRCGQTLPANGRRPRAFHRPDATVAGVVETDSLGPHASL